MSNCLNCKHNDKRAKFCPRMGVHTDLGYVLNCVSWTPTDEDVMKGLRRENADLRDALKALMLGTYAELCTNRDAPQCRECSMRGEDDRSCVCSSSHGAAGRRHVRRAFGG